MLKVGHQTERYLGFHRIGNKMWGAPVFKKADSPYRSPENSGRVFTNQTEARSGASPKLGLVPYDEIADVRFVTSDVKSARLGAHILSRFGLEGGELDLKANMSARVQVLDGEMQGEWRLSIQSYKNTFWNKIKQWLPFTREIQSPHVTFVAVEKMPHSSRCIDSVQSCFSRVKSLFVAQAKVTKIHVPNDVTAVAIPKERPPGSYEERFNQRPFTDIYTSLATFAFQNLERTYRHTLDPDPHYQFVQNEYGEFTLDKVADLESRYDKMSGRKKEVAVEAQKENNRIIVRGYRDFVMEEYGAWFVKDIKYRFGVDLEKMVKYGEPLLPEHVYRINMGAHEIDESVLSRVMYKLNHLMKAGEKHDSLSIQEYMLNNNVHKRHEMFCVREMRAVVSMMGDDIDISRVTMKEVRECLHEACSGMLPRHLQDATPEQVSVVYQILEPKEEDFDGMYTGRKIADYAIMGYYTRAEKTHFKPWLDLQELVQIHSDLRTVKDWDGYYELLSHVVSKKHNVVRDREEFWRVGRMIPAPDGVDGSRRFYVITSCTDDNKGDFNYTLEPASKGYDPQMPAIKLYRSTASDKYAMNGGKSVDADLSLSGPGASNREAADEYEVKFFDRLTIPVWVGYTELAKQQLETASSQRSLQRRLDKMKEAYATLKQAWVNKRNSDSDFTEDWKELDFSIKATASSLGEIRTYIDRVVAKLDFIAEREGESLEGKKGYDVAFVGHSLGGSLAQGGLYHYGVKRGRIPLPGHRFVCYASDPPGMARHENADFLHFGRKHEKLLVGLGQKWKVTHQMEYGDPVPMGGSVHLGATTRFDLLYKNWLDLDVRIFKPRTSTAEAPEITTAPTHGRRVGHAVEGRDYKFTHLTAKELNEFDNNINPFGEGSDLLRNTFGYRIIHSRRGAEAFRQGIAYIRGPILRQMDAIWKKVVHERGDEMRDKNGAFHVRLPYSEVLGKLV